MEENRLKLHEELCKVLGSRHVYFQPPSNIRMEYPAIVYSLKNINNNYANDRVYTRSFSYVVTVIDKDPDSVVVNKVSQLPMCVLDRPPYTADGLNHTVFDLYY